MIAPFLRKMYLKFQIQKPPTPTRMQHVFRNFLNRTNCGPCCCCSLSLAVLKHVLKIRRWKRFARISNIRGSVAPGRRTGPLFGDRAPRQYCGERASQLGSSACALRSNSCSSEYDLSWWKQHSVTAN